MLSAHEQEILRQIKDEIKRCLRDNSWMGDVDKTGKVAVTVDLFLENDTLTVYLNPGKDPERFREFYNRYGYLIELASEEVKADERNQYSKVRRFYP
jgi:hypothetical protein